MLSADRSDIPAHGETIRFELAQPTLCLFEHEAEINPLIGCKIKRGFHMAMRNDHTGLRRWAALQHEEMGSVLCNRGIARQPIRKTPGTIWNLSHQVPLFHRIVPRYITEMHKTVSPSSSRSLPAAFGGGAIIGTLGGLIGLGGAEFRLPLLIGPFRFAALEAVILNKAMSLVVVATALPFRAGTVSFGEVAAHWPIVLNLLAGSLAGAWFGAGWATRLKSETLYKVIAILMVGIAAVLMFGHDASASSQLLTGTAQMAAGVRVGFGIGVVASLMGVAGGELLIPTLVLLFGADIKLAGSLSLAISLPTMLVGFARYSRDQSFAVLGRNRAFLLVMAGGSIFGAFIGGMLLGIIPNAVLLPALALILLISAAKVWRHA